MRLAKTPKYIVCPVCETRSIVRPGALCTKHAATDDLLKALESFVRWATRANVINEPEDEEAIAKARAAIAKARGE